VRLCIDQTQPRESAQQWTKSIPASISVKLAPGLAKFRKLQTAALSRASEQRLPALDSEEGRAVFRVGAAATDAATLCAWQSMLHFHATFRIVRPRLTQGFAARRRFDRSNKNKAQKEGRRIS
jgi:hypothetical protein